MLPFMINFEIHLFLNLVCKFRGTGCSMEHTGFFSLCFIFVLLCMRSFLIFCIWLFNEYLQYHIISISISNIISILNAILVKSVLHCLIIRRTTLYLILKDTILIIELFIINRINAFAVVCTFSVKFWHKALRVLYCSYSA